MRWVLATLTAAAVLGTAGCDQPQTGSNATEGSNAPSAANSPDAANAPSGTSASNASDPKKEPIIPGAGPWAKLKPEQYKVTDSGLTYAVIKAGKGAEAKAGQPVTMQYTGWLKDTKEKFDSSRDPGKEPFGFMLGQGQVIPGWDEGVAGMKEGEQRQLVIPPDLGYGEMGTPDGAIPPNATLVFDVELVKAGS